MLDLPFEKWTLGDALAQRVEASGDAPFIRMVGGAPLSYRELQAQVLGLAEALEREGVGPGDRVVIMGGNCLATLRCWFALNLLGAADVTINTAYRGRPLVHAINTAQARLMLVGTRQLGLLAECEGDVPLLERVLHFDDETDAPVASSPGVRFARLELAPLPAAQAPSPGWQWPGARAQDLASIIFTSGTSGPAKGVMLPHAQTYLVSLESARQLQLREDDVYYIFHPLFHMSPRYVAIYAALIAGAQVCMDRAFSAADWLPRIRACGATVSIGHGPMLEMVHAMPERPDDADNPLRRLATSPFPWHIAADFERRFGVRGLEVWGMTEVNIPLWNSLDEPLRPGCGRLISDEYEIALVDPETDLPVPDGTAGELVVRARRPWTLMQGYFGMPEATLKAWRNLWFHTGDLAWKDDAGCYHFVDRLGDRIRRRAENISSYEIEVAAMQHPSVRECAAIGVASEFASDDDVLLVVVPAPDFDAATLLAHLARRLPHFMVPRYIDTLAELPRTPTNKVRKAALRERGVQGTTWDRKAHGMDLRALVAGRS
ncbi:ATP-dependent acyl-CoA ligase [Variovorax defluvii]|uniref:ATP-dependent acyl-CoA ligase n=1 Tax=Variovorax defluvii TaxID=913761 RepID=A0ABP8H6X2_9BURK